VTAARPVLFVCVENAGRSQIAEGFARKLGVNATSAGTRPAARINPVVVQAMREKGIDLSSKTPRTLTSKMIEDARLVVTMGCSIQDACPRPLIESMRKKWIEWSIDDPKGQPLERVREIRDEIERLVRQIAESKPTVQR